MLFKEKETELKNMWMLDIPELKDSLQIHRGILKFLKNFKWEIKYNHHKHHYHSQQTKFNLPFIYLRQYDLCGQTVKV